MRINKLRLLILDLVIVTKQVKSLKHVADHRVMQLLKWFEFSFVYKLSDIRIQILWDLN